MTDIPAPTGFFGELEAEFESAFTTVVTDAKELAVAIGTEVENDIKAAWTALAPTVLASIQTEATKLISGEEKFGNAVNNVVMTAETKGIPLAQADGQALVQNGFNWLQNKLAGG